MYNDAAPQENVNGHGGSRRKVTSIFQQGRRRRVLRTLARIFVEEVRADKSSVEDTQPSPQPFAHR